MYKDAVSHSKSCPDCAIAVGGGRPSRPPLQPIPVQRIFQIVGVDVMDLPRTEHGTSMFLFFKISYPSGLWCSQYQIRKQSELQSY